MIFKEVGDFYQIYFPYSKEKVERVKTTLENPRWQPKLKLWQAPITPRNEFLKQVYTGESNPYALYDQSITTSRLNYFKNKYEPMIKAIIPNLTLREHQWVMLYHLMVRQRCINGAWMRMGKTLPALLALILLSLRGAWFVTSVSAKSGIKRECGKWRINPDMYILTYHAFTEQVLNYPETIPQCVILDEGQAIKAGTKSNRGKAARKLVEHQLEKYDKHGVPSYLWLLSGTPDPKNPVDWWNVTESVRPGFLSENSVFRFQLENGYFEQKDGAYGGKYLEIQKDQGVNGWRPDKIKQLGSRLKGLVEIFRPEDWGTSIKLDHEVIKLPVPKPVKSAIKMIGKIKTGAELRGKLRQLDDGFQYEKGETDIVTLKTERKIDFYGSPKYDQFKSDLDLYSDVGRLVCYAYFTESVDRLTDLAVKEGWSVLQFSGKGVRPFNTTLTVDELLTEMDYSTDTKTVPKLIVICQSTTGNEGQEFSSADCTIMFSYPDRSDAYEQSCARMTSGASPNPKCIRHYSYLAIGDSMREALANKKEVQDLTREDLLEGMERDLNNEIEEEMEPMNYSEMKL